MSTLNNGGGGIKPIQKGVMNTNGSQIYAISISEVDLNKASINLNTAGGTRAGYIFFISSTSLRVVFESGVNGPSFSWEIIEYA
jgi:hypothetical protein